MVDPTVDDGAIGCVVCIHESLCGVFIEGVECDGFEGFFQLDLINILRSGPLPFCLFSFFGL